MKNTLVNIADEADDGLPEPGDSRLSGSGWRSAFGSLLPNRRAVIPWLLPITLLAAWTISTETGWVHPLILPKPTDVVIAAIDLARTRLPSDLLISTRRALSGLALGGSLALVLGFIAGLSRLGEELLDTTMHLKRTIPSLALMPLLIIWFGVGENMKTALIAFGVFFPIYINTYYGMKSVDPALVEVGRVYGLSGWTLFRKVILPGALPWIFVGLRFALGAMWLVLIVAETVGTSAGIGFITNTANEFMQTDVVLVIVLLYALLGKGADLAVRLLEHFFSPGITPTAAPAGSNIPEPFVSLMPLSIAPPLDSHDSLEGSPAAPPGAAVRVTGLHKSFGQVKVLLGVDLELRPGELVAVIGRSGCGKSTLLRLLAGLERPTRGEIALDDAPSRGLGAGTRVVFQDARLMPWLRVRENVALGLSSEEQARADRALQEVGLANRGNDWPTILSGGQRQRVALARALASEPRLLLLDEPLGALDALTRLTMQQLIERLWREHQFTALLVTHDVEEAVALADRIVLMDEGKITHEARVPFSRPRDRANPQFVALREKILARVHESEAHSP